MRNSIELAEYRKNIYQFLAMIYIREPAEKFIDMITNNKITYLFREMDLNFIDEIKNKDNEKIQEELSLEYTRLFIGPGRHISPYESVWRDGGPNLWGKSTVQIKKIVEFLGLEYNKSWTGLPDHISVEFELMQKLIEKEKSSYNKKNNSKQIKECLEIEQKFITEHICQWIPEFSDEVMKESNLLFYREMAELTKAYIELDKEQINKLLSVN